MHSKHTTNNAVVGGEEKGRTREFVLREGTLGLVVSFPPCQSLQDNLSLTVWLVPLPA